MNISAPFIQRPIATFLLAIALFVAGAAAFTQLPVAPLPRVDFPTIIGVGVAARRQPADDGVGGGDAARAPLRPHRRRQRDDLDVDARHHVDHAAVRSRPRRRSGRARRAGGDQRRRRRSAAEPAVRPNYRKVNPADAPILIFSLRSKTLPLSDSLRSRQHRSSRRRSRRSTASARSSSAAGSSRRCACRSIRRRWRGAA